MAVGEACLAPVAQAPTRRVFSRMDRQTTVIRAGVWSNAD